MPATKKVTTVTKQEVAEIVDEVLNAYMEDAEGNDEYDPFRKAMTDQLMPLFNKLSERIKQLESASATKPKVTKPSKSGSKSGGTRKPNFYSKWVGIIKHLPKGEDQNKEMAEFKITVTPRFTETAKTKQLFDEHKASILHNDKEIVGQELTLEELYTAITDASSIDAGFGNTMTRAAVMWALISDAEREQLKQTAIDAGLF